MKNNNDFDSFDSGIAIVVMIIIIMIGIAIYNNASKNSNKNNDIISIEPDPTPFIVPVPIPIPDITDVPIVPVVPDKSISKLDYENISDETLIKSRPQLVDIKIITDPSILIPIPLESNIPICPRYPEDYMTKTELLEYNKTVDLLESMTPVSTDIETNIYRTNIRIRRSLLPLFPLQMRRSR